MIVTSSLPPKSKPLSKVAEDLGETPGTSSTITAPAGIAVPFITESSATATTSHERTIAVVAALDHWSMFPMVANIGAKNPTGVLESSPHSGAFDPAEVSPIGPVAGANVPSAIRVQMFDETIQTSLPFASG